MYNAGLSPISLTLSDDSAIESVLTDIPFFCVGLMTFGVFTFVLILKRVNITAIYLYTSSFLAFAAGIFDLGHVLSQGRAKLTTGTGSDTSSGLVTVREIGLALSLGFNFIFLWHLVAQCPRNERYRTTNNMKSGANPAPYIHSASWKRWGFIGLLLQWSLLGLSFSIPVLQIVWRITPPNLRFGTVYIAEATIEVVTSALFILKIFLNIFLSPLTPLWRPVQSNIAPLVALSISTGLGLGNLVALAFSETTLGRFLRAVEMYILILFILITAFYKKAPDPSSTQNDQGKSFIRISEKPQVHLLRINPPIPPLITSSGIIDKRRSVVPGNNELRRPSIATTVSRLTWILPQNAERRSSAERIYTEDRELGMVPAEDTVARADSPSSQMKQSRKLSISIDKDLTSIGTNREEEVASNDRHWTALSIPSYYGMEQRSDHPPPPPPFLARGTDSPVYGLNGIMARSRDVGTQSRPHSSISFDELLRQQTELDKSIAALRLFSSTSPPDMPTSQPAVPASPPSGATNANVRSNRVSTNSYLGRKPDSASNQSDFSLSIFPAPPAASSEELPTSTKLERFVGRARTLRREPASAGATGMVTVKVAGVETPSLPVSPSRSEGTPRLESAGTQYDVTSFIGGLSVPTSGSAGSGLGTGGTPLSDVESEDEPSPQIVPITAPTRQPIRPMILASSAVLASPATPAASAERPREAVPSKREPNIPLRPFILRTPSRAMPVIVPSSTMVLIGPRSRKGLPSNSRRPTISGPSLPPDDGRSDQAPGAFERPRPPPSRFYS